MFQIRVATFLFTFLFIRIITAVRGKPIEAYLSSPAKFEKLNGTTIRCPSNIPSTAIIMNFDPQTEGIPKLRMKMSGWWFPPSFLCVDILDSEDNVVQRILDTEFGIETPTMTSTKETWIKKVPNWDADVRTYIGSEYGQIDYIGMWFREGLYDGWKWGGTKLQFPNKDTIAVYV